MLHFACVATYSDLILESNEVVIHLLQLDSLIGTKRRDSLNVLDAQIVPIIKLGKNV